MLAPISHLDDSARIAALEGRTEGLILALSTIVHGMAADAPQAREALGNLLNNFAETIRENPPWEDEIVAANAVFAIHHLAGLLTSALPKNFS